MNPSSSPIAEDPFERRKTGIGVRMTLLYSLVYVGFVVVSVFRPQWMAARAVLGLNLAVTYGLGLIVLAIVLAMLYNQLCRAPRRSGAEGGRQ